MTENYNNSNPGGGKFALTRWSVVLVAGDTKNPKSYEALSELCLSYWRPLYSFVRRKGYSPADAHDLTQGFFARLLEKNFLGSANPELGRFRSYLLGAMKNFLADNYDYNMAQKRGGGAIIIPIDIEPEEGRSKFEPVDDNTAEKLFDRQWALETLDKTMSALAEEYKSAGKAEHFSKLRKALLPNDKSSYKDIAVELGTTEGNVKVAIHRLRKKYKALLRKIISQTLADPSEVDDEIRHLFASLG
jgi:RNA polymerase sigma factor (sigma-70 family)